MAYFHPIESLYEGKIKYLLFHWSLAKGQEKHLMNFAVCVQLYVYVRVHVYKHVFAHLYVYIYYVHRMFKQVCICVCVFVCMYTR
jgi:hypothetical protein